MGLEMEARCKLGGAGQVSKGIDTNNGEGICGGGEGEEPGGYKVRMRRPSLPGQTARICESICTFLVFLIVASLIGPRHGILQFVFIHRT